MQTTGCYVNANFSHNAAFKNEIQKKSQLTEEEFEKRLSAQTLEGILTAVAESKISENDVKTVMQKIAEGKSLKESLAKSEVDLAGEVKRLLKEKPGLTDGAYMGLVMGKFKGQVSGKEVMDELKKQK